MLLIENNIRNGTRILAYYKDEWHIRELIVRGISSDRSLISFVGYEQWFSVDKWHILHVLEEHQVGPVVSSNKQATDTWDVI